MYYGLVQDALKEGSRVVGNSISWLLSSRQEREETEGAFPYKRAKHQITKSMCGSYDQSRAMDLRIPSKQ